ncbi:AfsR/SARP family transcriptional regulator [Nocardioides sp. AE5]|uniref:AfsR/SARP family transcriptional regulator n=1 Tax=Nocardioides sp. AE5 TaxID=2962573 RepID=UPI0028813DF1|nr:AfsR/SARP family transcriptional regulator [Nocardioides sp. AE5]MDT0200723.1 AfsR/SARP family transcriptional regulator [Nocardioides sp. AE5]
MRVQVLGPLSVVDASAPVPSGEVARRVLSVLAAEANRPVHPSRLADLVWPHANRPASNSLQAHVSRWRRVLGAHRIGYGPAGYTLRLTSDELDALAFEELVAAATHQRERGNLDRALATYDEALVLWRGPAFQEMADDDCVRNRALELEAQRTNVRLARIETWCQSGAHDQVLEDGGHLARDEPWNEPVHRALARAHYGRGDQVAALEVLAELERRLRDDLGLDLGVPTQLLRGQILRQEPALDVRPDAAGEQGLTTRRLTERIDQLGPRTRQVLLAASLSGDAVDTAQLRAALEMNGPGLADALSPALAAGLLIRSEDGIRFPPKLREHVAGLVGAGQALDLHRRLGESLLSRAGRTELLRRAADHLAKAAPGDSHSARLAIETDRRLTTIALSQGRHDDAVRHARRAVDCAQQMSTDEVAHAELWFSLAQVTHRAGLLDEAMDHYRTAAALPSAPAGIIIDSALAHEECSLHARRHRTGVHDPSVELLERALALAPEGPTSVRVRASLAQALSFSGAAERASGAAEDAVAAARRVAEPTLLAATLLRAMATHVPDAGAHERFALADEAATLAREAQADELELEALAALVPEAMREDDLTTAEAVITRVEHLADLQANVLHHWKVPMWRATLALAAGRHDEAEVLIEDFRLAAAADGYDDAPRIHAFQSILLALGRGKLDEASSILHEFDHDAAFEPWLAARLAVAYATGDHGEARELLVPWAARRFTLSRPFAGVRTFCACLVADAVLHLGDAATQSRLAEVVAPAAGQRPVLGAGAAMLADPADVLNRLQAACDPGDLL